VVNAGSASASEVVAAALQEAGRALIVGERTFGKNTVQQRFSLSNGGALRLTIARWTTPAGADLGDGVSPDVAVELPNDLTAEEVVARVEEVLASREAVRSRFAVV
jgi:carboxyl-terminal processing protease